MKLFVIILGVIGAGWLLALLPALYVMPLNYTIIFMLLGLAITTVAGVIGPVRGLWTGGWYLTEMADPRKPLMFLFRKSGVLDIVPVRRLKNVPFLYDKKNQRYVKEDEAPYNCSLHPVVPVVEGVSHGVHPEVAGGIQRVAEILGLERDTWNDYPEFRNKVLSRLQAGIPEDKREKLEEVNIPSQEQLNDLHVTKKDKKRQGIIDFIRNNPLPDDLLTVKWQGGTFNMAAYERSQIQKAAQTDFEAVLNLQESTLIKEKKRYKPSSGLDASTAMLIMIIAIVGVVFAYIAYALFGGA